MSTEQSYVGRGNFAISTTPEAQNASQISSTPDSRQSIPRVMSLNIYLGDPAHHLLFGLKHELDSIVRSMIIDFDPNQMEDHLERWNRYIQIGELITDLCARINFYAEELEDSLYKTTNPAREKNSDLFKKAEIAEWQRWSSHHPLLKKEVDNG